MPTSRFVLPTTAHKGKSRIWKDPAVESIIHRMHHGDPTLGWEGDERLGLYMIQDGPRAGCWEVVRWGEDGHPYTIMVSKPGATLIGLIPALAEGDQRRRNAQDIVALMDKADAEQEARDLAQIETAVDEFLRRSYESPSSRK